MDFLIASLEARKQGSKAFNYLEINDFQSRKLHAQPNHQSCLQK